MSLGLPDEPRGGAGESTATRSDGSEPAAPNGGRDTPAQTREFPCQSCGAKLQFHIGQQQLACPYCGFRKALTFAPGESVEEQDLEAALARLAAQQAPSTALGELEIRCQGCGASVAFAGQLTTTECAFCGAAVHREDAHKCPERLRVDAVVPFQVTQDSARALLRKWVQALWFAPTEFKRRGITGRFSGVYLPFWTFDAMTRCQYRGERGDDYTVVVGSGKNRRTVTRTRWSDASGSFERFFDDVTIVATRAFDRARLAALEPWPIERAVPFNTELLAGKQAMTYDIDLPTGFAEAKVLMREELDAEARRRIGGDRQRVHSLDVRNSALAYKHTLFPVWMLAYRYQEESYQVMINAITGEVEGERPWSAWKLGFFSLAVLLLAFWIYWLAR